MLVFTRKRDERIVINNGEIELCIVEIRGDKVRIGVQAPKHIPVNRFEVQRRIDEQNARNDHSVTSGPAEIL